MLSKIRKVKQIKLNNKLRIVNTNVKAVLLYAQNFTTEMVRQGTQHYTLEKDQTTTHEKLK